MIRLLGTCASRSILWSWLCSTVCLFAYFFACNVKSQKWVTNFFFLIFCCKLEKWWAQLEQVRRAQKVQEMAQKWHLRGFDKNRIHSYLFFYLNMKVLMVLLAKTICLGKIWILSYVSKTSRPFRMQDSLNYNVSQTGWV